MQIYMTPPSVPFGLGGRCWNILLCSMTGSDVIPTGNSGRTRYCSILPPTKSSDTSASVSLCRTNFQCCYLKFYYFCFRWLSSYRRSKRKVWQQLHYSGTCTGTINLLQCSHLNLEGAQYYSQSTLELFPVPGELPVSPMSQSEWLSSGRQCSQSEGEMPFPWQVLLLSSSSPEVPEGKDA